MINLIPPQGRAAVKHEYMLRVWSVYAAMLSGVFIAGIALLVPTYVLVSMQLTSTATDNSRMAAIASDFKRAEGEIEVANDIAARLGSTFSDVAISGIITEVTARAPQGITFTTFQAERVEGELHDIKVQGVARSRGALASFKAKLEESPYFDAVTLPISDLARDSDLPFAITVALKEK